MASNHIAFALCIALSLLAACESMRRHRSTGKFKIPFMPHSKEAKHLKIAFNQYVNRLKRSALFVPQDIGDFEIPKPKVYGACKYTFELDEKENRIPRKMWKAKCENRDLLCGHGLEMCSPITYPLPVMLIDGQKLIPTFENTVVSYQCIRETNLRPAPTIATPVQ